MSHESFGVCVYCNRNLEENERYCYFCEYDVSEVRNKEERAEILRKRNN